MGPEMVLHPIEIVDEFRTHFGYVLQQHIEIAMIHLASQAERAGSIPATRSTLCHKGLRPISPRQNSRSFTGGFTVDVHLLFRVAP